MVTKYFEPGELVDIKKGRWGRVIARGVLIKKLYTTYDPRYDKWSVLIDGEVKTCTTDCIRRISNEVGS